LNKKGGKMEKKLDEGEKELIPIPKAQPVSIFGAERPAQIIERAKEVAEVLMDIIEKKKAYVLIGRKKYVKCEGWTAMAGMLKTIPFPEYSRRFERNGIIGYEARVLLRREGQDIGAGEAECSKAEKNWKDREDFQLRSMALTRATGKACRLAFSWIMVLAGYESTPAEEMNAEAEEMKERAEAPKSKESATSHFFTTKEKELWDRMIKSHLLTEEERKQLLNLDRIDDRREALGRWWGWGSKVGERVKREKTKPKPPKDEPIEAIFETEEKPMPKKENVPTEKIFETNFKQKMEKDQREYEQTKKKTPESRVAQLLYLFVKRGIPEIPAQERFIKKTLGVPKKLGELTVEEQAKVEEKLKKTMIFT